MNCECLSGCPFFNDKMKSQPSIANMMKKKFCKGDNSNCARYMVAKALGKPKVPANLYPNQEKIAKDLISKG